MKAYKVLDVENRVSGKKSDIKNMIAKSIIPAIIYAKDGKNPCISISLKQMNAIVLDPSAMTRIYELKLAGKSFFCVLKDVQFNAENDMVRHVDFKEVSKGDVVNVNVPVKIINKEICPGVKSGGDVYVLSYNVLLKCNVESIPYAIEIDVKDSEMGDKFFLRDIKLPEGCQMIKDVILIRVAGRRVIKAETTAETTETPAEGTTEGATATTADAGNKEQTAGK